MSSEQTSPTQPSAQSHQPIIQSAPTPQPGLPAPPTQSTQPVPQSAHLADPATKPAVTKTTKPAAGKPEGLDHPKRVVGIVMGSDSDWATMEPAANALSEFGIGFESDVISAHRMPEEMVRYGREAHKRGLKVIIAGAGGAAHLPGMLAALTPLPVIGVPVPLKHLDGVDSLLSIVQMPSGVPVATVSIGNARNAGLLAVRILAASDPELMAKIIEFQRNLRDTAVAKGSIVRQHCH